MKMSPDDYVDEMTNVIESLLLHKTKFVWNWLKQIVAETRTLYHIS